MDEQRVEIGKGKVFIWMHNIRSKDKADQQQLESIHACVNEYNGKLPSDNWDFKRWLSTLNYSIKKD